MQTREQIHFRYIQMPCCRTQLCWVNPRLPMFCPECGVGPQLEAVKSAVVATDEKAWIVYNI